MHGLSIIIPIYNVQDYLEECLQSINDSIKDYSAIQIILVNDGSTDQSEVIAKKFVDEHSHFEYVVKKNGGLSDARNYGLNYAKYDYVSFIDSDDFIDENYFGEIFKELHLQPDMIIFDWVDVIDGKKEKVVAGMDISNSLWSVQPSAWNKVFKKSIFDEVKFPKGKIYEDVGTTYKALFYVEKYTYIEKPLYCYRKNRGGSILSTISPKINDIYEVLEDTYSFYSEKEMLSEEKNDGLCYQYVKLLMWSNMYRQLKLYKLNMIGFYKQMKYTRELVYSRFSDWTNNEYLMKNESYFTDRFGPNYVKRIDSMGQNFFTTIQVLLILIARNRRKK